jgi:heterotetrameric sarcosine oxidase gamma subunit
MPDAPFRRSPLFHRPPIQGEGGALRMEEKAFTGKFIVRADAQAAGLLLRAALGTGLPLEPLTSSTSGETSFLWMGPDEWTLVTSAGEAENKSTAARKALAGVHHQLVSVSDYYTIIEVAGRMAREALMKLTSLDLHPRAFKPGMVTGSVFGRVNAMIWLPPGAGGEEAFQLFIRWSMADYLWCAIADAGREWGVPEQVPVKGEALTIG